MLTKREMEQIFMAVMAANITWVPGRGAHIKVTDFLNLLGVYCESPAKVENVTVDGGENFELKFADEQAPGDGNAPASPKG